MKASIVIPAYNEENNIADAIKCALAQIHDGFEIEVIIVNNACTDKTPMIARQFHVKVLDEKRKGLLFARECGRKAATGDVIVNMDADCRPDEKWLSKGIRRFNDEKVVALSGPYDYYDGSSFFRYGSLYVQKVMYTLANWFVQLPFIHLGGVVNGGNGFFRAKTLEKAGYNISLKLWDDVLGEDTDTAKRISKYGKVVFDSSVVMKTSARRFERQGAMKTAFRYWLYFFKILFKRE